MSGSGKTPRPPSPGFVLREWFMKPLGYSAYRVAKDTLIAPIALSEILRGKRGISPAVALKLERYLGVGADFWLKLQAICDLAKAEAKGAAEGVLRCSAATDLNYGVEESRGPAGCWRSAEWNLSADKTAPLGTLNTPRRPGGGEDKAKARRQEFKDKNKSRLAGEPRVRESVSGERLPSAR